MFDNDIEKHIGPYNIVRSGEDSGRTAVEWLFPDAGRNLSGDDKWRHYWFPSPSYNVRFIFENHYLRLKYPESFWYE